MGAKKLTVRVDDELGSQLDLVAEVQEESINTVVTTAIRQYIDALRGDSAFKEKAKAVLDRRRRALKAFEE